MLSDRVYQIRKTAIHTIKLLCKRLGLKWSESTALPIFYSFYDNKNYLYRLNYLFGISEIYKYISPSLLEVEINNICKMVKDPVANIRINVLKTLSRIYLSKHSKSLQERILKIAKYLEKDNDYDITYMVNKLKGSNFKISAQKILKENYK